MSAFGSRVKDEVVYAIENLAQDEAQRGRSLPDAIESIMEAVQYALVSATRQYFDRQQEGK